MPILSDILSCKQPVSILILFSISSVQVGQQVIKLIATAYFLTRTKHTYYCIVHKRYWTLNFGFLTVSQSALCVLAACARHFVKQHLQPSF